MKKIAFLLALVTLLLTGCAGNVAPDQTGPVMGTDVSKPIETMPTLPGTEPPTDPPTEPSTEPPTEPSTAPTMPPFTLSDEVIPGEHTLRNFLATALSPVGEVCYVWSGGHTDQLASTIGKISTWKTYFDKQNSDYDFKTHMYSTPEEYGLDCSGYVAWVVYNTMESVSGKGTYITQGKNFAWSLANSWHLGTREKKYVSANSVKVGDIVSMDQEESHVWIVLGTFDDGSILMVHASPPGVMICGTVFEEDVETEASLLAKKYMDKFPEWSAKFDSHTRLSDKYLRYFPVFSWSGKVLSDPEGVANYDPETLLYNLIRR